MLPSRSMVLAEGISIKVLQHVLLSLVRTNSVRQFIFTGKFVTFVFLKRINFKIRFNARPHRFFITFMRKAIKCNFTVMKSNSPKIQRKLQNFIKSTFRRCSIKKLLLKISQNSRLCRSLFFIKFLILSPATLVKETSTQMFLFYEIFKNNRKWPRKEFIRMS